MNTDPGEEDEFIAGHGWGPSGCKSKKKSKRGPWWTTKEGVRMAIRDMETSHIENCLRYLERRKLHVELEFASLPEPNGEHAQDAFNHEVEAFQNADVRDVFPIYVKLEEELARREARELKRAQRKKS